MTLFDKFKEARETFHALMGNDLLPIGLSTDRLYSATEGEIFGRRTILAGTNNYLGLTFHPEVIEAAKHALDCFGTGSTGSRMASGTYSGHLELESELADFFGKSVAIVFTTGYQANLGMISTLVGSDDTIFIDADSHASIYDGARMSGADIYRFRHNNPQDLAKRLNRLGDQAKGALVVLEGIYSMLGDRALLKEFIEVKKKYECYLLLDEAHSLGMLGTQGQGLAEELGVSEDIDFIVGTFSKSLGCIGGYCVSNLEEMDLVRNAIRAYMFTASSTPSVIATARAALRIMRNSPDLRERLWHNARRAYDALKRLGFQLGPEPSPVIAAVIPTANQAVAAWRILLEHGVYVNLVVPPASPGSYSLLRLSLSSSHSDEQVDQIINGYKEVQAKL